MSAKEPKVLFTTVYKDNPRQVYDWFERNTDTPFRYTVSRILYFGLRFLKQNLPQIEVLENPTWEEYQRKLRETKWDIVGFSFYLDDIPEILGMVAEAREVGVKEIWAGNYGALTQDIQDKFDRIFVGYAEEQIARELDWELPKDLLHPPLVNFVGLSGIGPVLRYGILFTNRGCAVGCTFCQSPAFYPRPVAIPMESIDRVLRYYKEVGIKHVLILDEYFGLIRSQGEKTVDLLDKYGFKWGPMTRVGQLKKDADRWMQKGMILALMGIETLNNQTLQDINKKQTGQDSVDLVTHLVDSGIHVIGYYIIGFPSETERSIKEDIQKVAALKMDITQICIITPLPQTPQWKELDEKYGIWDRDWHHYNAKYMVWNHPHVKPQRMQELLRWSFRQTYPWWRTFGMTWKYLRIFGGPEQSRVDGLGYMARGWLDATGEDYFPKMIPLFAHDGQPRWRPADQATKDPNLIAMVKAGVLPGQGVAVWQGQGDLKGQVIAVAPRA